MAKIKFKMSFEKFSFEYEGDQDKAEKLQGGINQLLGSLAETQNQIIEVEARPIESPQHMLLDNSSNNNSNSPKRRNRKAKKNSNGSSPISESETSSEQSNRSARSSKSPIRPLLVRLIQENFFSEKRLVGVVREELSKKGHNYESRGISSSLLSLTRDEHLSRENSSGQWEYIKGKVDVPTGS
ncbi:MAG TPA: hypothetical protein VF692_04380 [Pyrinomonadaceae bacterium]